MNRRHVIPLALKGALVVLSTSAGMFLLSALRSPLGISLGFVCLYIAFFVNAAYKVKDRCAKHIGERY